MANERYMIASSIGEETIPDFLASSFPNNVKPLSHKYLTKKTHNLLPKDSTLVVPSDTETAGSAICRSTSDQSVFEKELNSLEVSARTPYSYPTETLRKSSGNSNSGNIAPSTVVPPINKAPTFDVISDAASSSHFSFESGASNDGFNRSVKPPALISESNLTPIKNKKVRKPPPVTILTDNLKPPSTQTPDSLTPVSLSPSPHSAPPQVPELTVQTIQSEHLSPEVVYPSSTRKVSPTTMSQMIPGFPDNVNDPAVWTSDRIKMWLRHYQFHEAWCVLIDKYQLYEDKFMKLTSYGEINQYIAELKEIDHSYDDLGSSAASRFISLLRKTLSTAGPGSGSGSRSNSESRSGSGSSPLATTAAAATAPTLISSSRGSLDLNSNLEKVKDAHINNYSLIHGRSTSDSAPSSTAKMVEVNHQRVGSLSSVSTSGSRTETLKPNTTGSSLYSSSSTKKRPVSAFEIPHKFSPTSASTSSSRASVFFKRNNKSADMDSVSTASTSTSTGTFSKSFFSSSSSSSHLPITGSPATSLTSFATFNGTSPTSFHEQQQHNDQIKKPSAKDSLFSKWRRHKSKGSSGNSIKDILMTTSPVSPTVSGPLGAASDRLPSPHEKRPKDKKDSITSFVIDKKYLPTPQSSNSDKYVLLSMDNKTFQPVNIGSCSSLADFYSILRQTFDNSSGFSVHLTEFGFDPGLALDEDVISGIVRMRFGNISGKLLIQFENDAAGDDFTMDHLSVPESRNFYDQDSLMSLANTSGSSFDVGSLSNDMPNHSHIAPGSWSPSENVDVKKPPRVKGYPKTPLHYYEAKPSVAPDGQGGDYMSFKKVAEAAVPEAENDKDADQEEARKKEMEEFFKKRAQQEATKMMKLKRTNSKLLRKPPPPPTSKPTATTTTSTTTTTTAAATSKPKLSTLDTSKSSFRILRPVDRGEIDFDKRRESPFTKSANTSPINTTTTSNKLPAEDLQSGSMTFNKPSLSHKSKSTEDPRYSILPKLDPVKEAPSTPGSSLGTPISAISTNSTLSSNADTLTSLGMNPVSITAKSSSSVYSATPPVATSTTTSTPFPSAAVTKSKGLEEDNSFLPLTQPGSLQRSTRVHSLHRYRSIRRGGSVSSVAPSSANSISISTPSSSAAGAAGTAGRGDLSFQENEISFADVPELPSSSSDEEDQDHGQQEGGNSATEDFWVQSTAPASKNANNTTSFNSDISDLSTLRPGRDVLYEHIEQFFPGDVLDRPVVMDQEDSNDVEKPIPKKPQLKRVVSTSFKDDDDSLIKPRRTKTIRAVVREARLRESELQTHSSQNSQSSSDSGPSITPPLNTQAEQLKRQESMALLRRRSTRMWGKSVTEVKNSDSSSLATNTNLTKTNIININNSNNNNHYQTQQNKTSTTNISKIRRNKNGEIEDYQWVKGKLIGRGTFGEVYLALNVTTGEMIAVKQVKILQTANMADNGVDALKSEVDTLKDLDHVNVVQYLGFEKTTTEYNLFLEYIAGGSVASCLSAYGRFEEPLVRSITKQVLSGLSYLHSNGILHRDMKADNLLIDLDGVCKITDFGISKKSMSNSVYDNFVGTSMKGTVFWMAPEVVDSQGEGYSAKVDIWSLGCVVLEMFAGKRPWSDYEMVQAMFKIGKDRTPPPIPEETKGFISSCGLNFFRRCWEIDPVKRPTAQDLVLDLFCSESVVGGFDFSKTALAALMIKSRKPGLSSGTSSANQSK